MRAICSRWVLLWPLSSNMLMMLVVSFWSISGEDEMRYARQSSPLKVAVDVSGGWQDCGLMMRLVLDGFRYSCVEILPFGSRVS